MSVKRSNPWRLAGWGTVGVLLLLPLVFGAPWTGSDYVFAAVLLGSVGGALELTFRKTSNASYRIAVGIAVAASFLLIWINGAVGIIGDEGEAANLLYLLVVAIALGGSIFAGFRARGMAVTMLIAGLATAAVPFVAALLGWGRTESLLAPEVTVLTFFFTGMWVLSAALFRKAAA